MTHISVEPQGKVYLCKCPLESDLKNTFTFASATAQLNYFEGLQSTIVAGDDYVYVRKDNKIRVEIPYDDIDLYNYMWYVNRGFNSPKRYFCFIDKLEYINENTTDIFFHTDVFQTWYWNLTWNRCFVEREHVNDDSFGANTVPENVELGDYVCNQVRDLFNPGNKVYIALAASYVPDELNYNTFNTHYNGVYCGTPVILFEEPLAVTNYIRILDGRNKGDSIVALYLVPSNMFLNVDLIHKESISIDGITTDLWIIPNSDSATDMYNSAWLVNSTLDGYTPKNNKLFTYPYNYAYITNNVGSQAEIHYEDFDYSTQGGQLRFGFKIVGALTPGCSIRCYPQHYKKQLDDSSTAKSFDYGITGPKYPICSWKTDVYTNWLTSQGVNLGISFASSIASLGVGAGLIATGAGTGVGIGMVAAGVTGIAGSIASVYQHSLVPPQSEGNTNSGDVTFSAGKMRIPMHQMSIRYEFARIIDDYFSAYGYKVNRIKVPNITGRSQWNFVKTIDCNVDGDVPQEDLQTIRDAMNRGVTFWHTPANIYNYSLNNPIV